MLWLGKVLLTLMRLSKPRGSPPLNSTGEPTRGSGVDLPRIIVTIANSFLIAFKERSTRQGHLRSAHTGWLAPNDYYYDYYMASTIYRLLAPFAIIELYRNFHPKTRPVLWRVLVTQAHIYEALLRTREMKLTDLGNDPTPKLIQPLSEKERLDFDWRQSSEEATDDEVLKQPFD